jgi:hypothetical protein
MDMISELSSLNINSSKYETSSNSENYINELYKLKKENQEKYNNLKDNIKVLEEIIEDTEMRLNKTRNHIDYLETTYDNTMKLFIDITRNKH